MNLYIIYLYTEVLLKKIMYNLYSYKVPILCIMNLYKDIHY